MRDYVSPYGHSEAWHGINMGATKKFWKKAKWICKILTNEKKKKDL